MKGDIRRSFDWRFGFIWFVKIRRRWAFRHKIFCKTTTRSFISDVHWLNSRNFWRTQELQAQQKNHLHPFGQRLLQSVQCIIDYETKCHPHNPYILLWHRFWAFGHRSHKPYEFFGLISESTKGTSTGSMSWSSVRRGSSSSFNAASAALANGNVTCSGI